MREILFRGKRVDNGEWVYGSFCMDAVEQKNGLCGVDGFIRLYDPTAGKMQMHEVDRETVGQFTGLTDKNGKKIFEGDIVEGADFTAEDGGYGVVSFVDGAFEVSGNNVAGTFNENYYGREFEVIGNIHDNPELLEEVSEYGK